MSTSNVSAISSITSLKNDIQCTYEWPLNTSKIGEEYISPKFWAKEEDLQWCLKIRGRRDVTLDTERFEDHLLFLYCLSGDIIQKYGPITGSVKFTVLVDEESERSFTEERKFTFGDVIDELREYKVVCCQSFDFYPRWHIYPATLVCELSYTKHNNIPSALEYNLSQDVEQLLSAEDFSDVTILVKGKEYHVHKCILAARSSVFKAMFKNNMKESWSDRVVIEDVDQDVFAEMLYFVYTGQVKNLNELAFELLQVADKFDLKALMMVCEKFLIEKLAEDNAIRMLMLADLHNATRLKTATLRFISFNLQFEDFKNTEAWKNITTSRPSLAYDLIEVCLHKSNTAL